MITTTLLLNNLGNIHQKPENGKNGKQKNQMIIHPLSGILYNHLVLPVLNSNNPSILQIVTICFLM